MLRPEYQKGKQYTGDSSQGIRLALVPLWGSKNEVVAPLCCFQNTIFGQMFWLKVIKALISWNQHLYYFVCTFLPAAICNLSYSKFSLGIRG